MLKMASPMQVRVINLQGTNYVFTLAPTFHPIAEVGCTAAASKTRKNIIITLQVRPCVCSSLEEHHLPIMRPASSLLRQMVQSAGLLQSLFMTS